MRKPASLALCIALLAAMAPAAADVVPDSCPPAACEAIVRAAPPIRLPEPARLASAVDVTAALRAAVPDAGAVPRLRARSLLAELVWWQQRLGLPRSQRMRSLTPDVRRALSVLLAGARRAETVRSQGVLGHPNFGRAARRALARYGSQRIAARRPSTALAHLAARIDRAALARAAAIMADAADRAASSVAARGTDVCTGATQAPSEIGGVIAMDTAGARTRYDKPYLVTLDVGGCDEYVGEIAAADGAERPAGITIDLGADADAYTAPAETFAFGAASEGVALLLDTGGDDNYASAGYAAQGAGIVGGVGILADLGGDDRYALNGAQGGYGAQGIGTLGFGALLDLGGDDEYVYNFDPGEATFGSRLLGAHGAGIVGQAVLADAAGDDRYSARTVGNIVSLEAQGAGDFLQGNYGVLVDASGDDGYEVDADVASAAGGASGAASGQGLGIFDAVGLLLDGGGDDRYSLVAVGDGATAGVAEAMGQGAASGSLRDPAWGGLVDLSGDDVYTATGSASADDDAPTAAGSLAQGFGLLDGIGVLVDGAGDDARVQSGDARSTLVTGQGAGLAAAVGVLVDRAGNDSYASGDLSQGYGAGFDFGDFSVPGGNGALVDAGGRDAFSGPGRSSTFWTQGEDGVGIGIAGGTAAPIVLDLFDAFFPGFRPHPLVEVAIASPSPSATLHGDFTVAGTAGAAPLEPDAVEWRADDAPWTLARKGATWQTWSATADVDALSEGTHKLFARAWASGLDSAIAEIVVEVERWLPTWDVRPEAAGVQIGFDLATRAGEPVDGANVTVEIRSSSGELVTSLVPTSSGGGRYEASWSPSARGDYVVRAVLPGQLLGEIQLAT